MYKFSPILRNTLPFRVFDGHLEVFDDDEYKSVFNITNASLLNILKDKNVLITRQVITDYLKALGLPYILNQFIINNYSYIPPSINISDSGEVSIYLDELSGFSNVELDPITGKILVTSNGNGPDRIENNSATGEVIGVYLNDQLDNYDARFIQHYGVLTPDNIAEYWYRTGKYSAQLLDFATEGRDIPVNLQYCYESGVQGIPVPEAVTADEIYDLMYVDDGGIISELDDAEVHNLQYEHDEGTWINSRIILINNYTTQLGELLSGLITLNSSINSPEKSIPLVRRNHISDYVSFDHNVSSQAGDPILKGEDGLYYEFEMLRYQYDDPSSRPGPDENYEADGRPEVIDGNEPYKLIYQQYTDNKEASFNNIVNKGDVVEIIFEYKMNTDIDALYKQTIYIVIDEAATEEGDIIPIRMKTATGFIFEITTDNLVMYSSNQYITDYRIISARTINDASQSNS